MAKDQSPSPETIRKKLKKLKKKEAELAKVCILNPFSIYLFYAQIYHCLNSSMDMTWYCMLFLLIGHAFVVIGKF